MSPTRNGKIARLPKHIRDELSERLERAEPESAVLAWLNGQAEMKPPGKAGAPTLTKEDLAQARAPRHPELLLQQEALAASRLMAEEVAALNPAGSEPLTERLAAWLAVRYVAQSRWLRESTGDPERDWRRLREFSSDVAGLRRGDQNAEGLRIERERLHVQAEDGLLRYKKRVLVGLETLKKFVARHPQAQAAFVALADQVQTPLDTVPGNP